jgi:RNA polymerase sigma factor (sigma-70 family)
MEERTAHQGRVRATDIADDIRHYLSKGENVDRLFGILCSYIRRSSLRFSSEADLRDTAQEVLQGVAEVALTKFETYHGNADTIEPWVLRIAMNRVKQKQDEVIKHSKRELSIEALSKHSTTLDEQNDFLASLIVGTFDDPLRECDVREQLQTALASLSPQEREIVLLHEQCGFDYHEIAQRLGLSDVAARVYSSRALNRLRATRRQLKDDKRGENNE